jgi:hypothetical protein
VDEDLEPGDVASVLVQFIEMRDGKAVVRLPNGSKTSIVAEALDLVARSDDLPRHPTRDDLTTGDLLAKYRRAL